MEHSEEAAADGAAKRHRMASKAHARRRLSPEPQVGRKPPSPGLVSHVWANPGAKAREVCCPPRFTMEPRTKWFQKERSSSCSGRPESKASSSSRPNPEALLQIRCRIDRHATRMSLLRTTRPKPGDRGPRQRGKTCERQGWQVINAPNRETVMIHRISRRSGACHRGKGLLDE